MVALLLTHQPGSLNMQDGRGYTPLMRAAKHNKVPIIKHLLDQGARIGKANKSQRTALHIAVIFGSLEATRFLLEKGADVSFPDKLGWTPLHMSCSDDSHSALVELLVRHGAAVDVRTVRGETSLFLAAQDGKTAALEALAAKGANVHATSPGLGSQPPLARAAFYGHTTTVLAILRLFDNLNKKKADRNLALCAAISNNHLEVVDLLLNHGANIDTIHELATPLHRAVEKGYSEVVEMFLDRHANIEAVGRDNMRSLHIACNLSKENPKTVELLLKRGAQVNARGGPKKKKMALHFAVMNGLRETTRLLLEYGADPRARNANNKLPEELVRDYCSDVDTKEFLLDLLMSKYP